MKIFLLSRTDPLRPSSYSGLEMRFATCFAENGHSVEYVVPSYSQKSGINITEIYRIFDVKKNFKITFMRTPLFDYKPRTLTSAVLLFYHLKTALKMLFTLKRNSDTQIAVISSDAVCLLPYILLFRNHNPKKVKTFMWTHEYMVQTGRFSWACRKSSAIIATNSALKSDIVRDFGISESKIVISLNTVLAKQLKYYRRKYEFRKKLNLKLNAKIVLYSGRIFRNQKEVRYIFQAASLLPEYMFLFTGGNQDVIDYFKKYIKQLSINNVFFTGYINDFSLIKFYQNSADILVSYYSMHDIDTRQNLPTKIAEYMSTGNPIVTWNMPSARDLINKNNVLLIEPESPEALASAIKTLMEDTHLASCLAQNAYHTIRDITVEKKATDIINFIKALF